MRQWLRSTRGREWARILGVRPWHVAVAATLAVAIAALEGLSVGLLVPLARGVVEHDFDFVRQMPVLGPVAGRLADAVGGDPFGVLFVTLAAAAFLAAVAKSAASYGAHLFGSYWFGVYLARANDYVLARYLEFGKRYFDRANQGRVQAVLGYTGELVDTLKLGQRALVDVLTMLAYVGVMLWISPLLTLFVAVCLPIMQLALRWITRRIRRLSSQLNESTLGYHGTTQNILSSVPLFKAYAQEAAARRSFARDNERLRRLNFLINGIQGVITPFQEVVILLVMLLTIAFVAFGGIRIETARLAGFLVFFYAARVALPRVAALHETVVTLAARRPQLEELGSLLDDDAKHIVPDGDVEFTGLREAIELRDLSFDYVEGVPVLRHISVCFERGRVTALVGPSGGGKSTIAELLMGFYEAPPGAILLDGVDLRSFRIATLRDRVAFVSQEVFLFNDTLRANLLVGARVPPADAELHLALERARLAALVRTLPEGLETLLGDRGVRLSGGERQRVAICRAFLRQPEILILDEATSALDSETERMVQESIEELTRGRTTIVIAHRLSTVAHADAVVVLDEGRIVEHGPPARLLESGVRFRALWELQHRAAPV